MATIVLVVGTTGTLTSGDVVAQGRLVAAGHTVVLRNDEDAEYTGSYDGVFVADSSSGGTFGSKYDTVAKPGITCENASWRLGSFLGGIDGTQWTVQSVDGNAGFTGTHTVYTTTISQQGIDTDVLPGGATVVARLAGDADHGVYVTYAAGGALTSGTAPAKRVFLRIPNAGMPNLTATGEDLLDAAIIWAFGTTGTNIDRTGGAAASSAGSGARSVVAANFIDRTGGGAARGAGSGTRIVTVPYLRAGGAAARGAGSGAKVVTSAPLLPSQVLDLSYWHLTTPEDEGDGTAEQIDQPALDSYESANFFVDENGFVVCIAPVDGFSTSAASGATRMELRQHRKGTYANAAMDPNAAGRWQMTITTSADPTSVTGGSNPRQELIIAQIHGAASTPIPLILSAEWTSGGNPVTPRVRIFKNGPGFANLITGITTSTRLTFRIRIEDSRLKLWGVAGEVGDLAPLTSPQYDWPISDFTDQEDWYFKGGAYHKTTITSGSSGQGIAKISFLEVLEPTDADPPTSVTYSETGGGAARGAGSGARTLSPAAVHAKTGGGAATAAGSGTRTLSPAASHVKTGGATARSAGSGARALASAALHVKAGGAAARAAGSGVQVHSSAVVHVLAGGAAASGAGVGEVEHGLPESHERTGGAAARAAGSAAQQVSHTYVTTGGAAAIGAGSGVKDVTSIAKTGGGAAAGAGSGLLQTGGGVEHARTGGANATAAGSGTRTTQSADVHVRAGGAACSAAGSGAGDVQNAVVHTRAGGASPSAAGTGPAQHVPAARHDRTGGGATAGAGAGTRELGAPTVHTKSGGAAALGTGDGAHSIVGAVVHVRTGGAVARGSGIGLVEVIPPAVHVRAGGGVLAVAGSGRGRVGGRLRAAVPVAIGQFRSGTPVRR